mmetsp:Transcript_1454/g.4383  ORF Transcript_1454/g.4383 Transcript_1454/m.4383 type:complete len:465 (-) Transcript_1454:1136-2530(-)
MVVGETLPVPDALHLGHDAVDQLAPTREGAAFRLEGATAAVDRLEGIVPAAQVAAPVLLAENAGCREPEILIGVARVNCDRVLPTALVLAIFGFLAHPGLDRLGSAHREFGRRAAHLAQHLATGVQVRRVLEAGLEVVDFVPQCRDGVLRAALAVLGVLGQLRCGLELADGLLVQVALLCQLLFEALDGGHLLDHDAVERLAAVLDRAVWRRGTVGSGSCCRLAGASGRLTRHLCGVVRGRCRKLEVLHFALEARDVCSVQAAHLLHLILALVDVLDQRLDVLEGVDLGSAGLVHALAQVLEQELGLVVRNLRGSLHALAEGGLHLVHPLCHFLRHLGANLCFEVHGAHPGVRQLVHEGGDDRVLGRRDDTVEVLDVVARDAGGLVAGLGLLRAGREWGRRWPHGVKLANRLASSARGADGGCLDDPRGLRARDTAAARGELGKGGAARDHARDLDILDESSVL